MTDRTTTPTAAPAQPAARPDATRPPDDGDALRASQERLAFVFENMDQGFCVFEMLHDDAGAPVDYRFLEVNGKFEAHTGLHAPVGRTARELVPNLEQHWVDIYGEVARTGVAHRFEQGSLAMGRVFDVEAIRVGEPAERKVALLFRDVTSRKQAEEALREQQARLEQALRVKDEFLGLVSHELRTPLTVIIGMSRLLSSTSLPPDEARGIAHDIAESADVLNELVEAMLLLARLDRSEAVQLREPVLLYRVATDVLVRVGQRMPAATLDLVIEDPGVMVEGQPTWVTRVMENFVVNAAKYAGPAPRVTLVISRVDGHARVRVLDDGPGLGSDATRLFEPFYRSPGSAEVAPGVGLGLAVAQRIVTLMDGSIWARNRDTGGAEFGFELPIGGADA